MIRVRFEGGPLDGVTKDADHLDVAPFYIHADAGGEVATGPMSGAGKTKYYLMRNDTKKSVFVYHVAA